MMMNLNLFLVAAVWIAIIATVSVSAAKEPAAAASDFTREDIVKKELEEQERELANYGVPYSNGYAAYGSNSYGSGNSYPDRYTNNNYGYSTPPANTGYASYPATGYDRYPTYSRTSTTSYSGGGYSSSGGYYGGKGGKGGGYYGGKGGKGGYGRGGNTGGSFYYSGSSSTPVYTTNTYGSNHGSSGNYGNTYGHGSSNGRSSHNNGYGK
eukprot:CAMPEP_0170928986 /NCGR_PEP_ID=MMETSP0735-20130129/14553_1 /TAXON_ID=186038 /ORGANISM="Fragilariopsis kerguelensis, Strain L26-C5" /LENGTH=209 /DNA_ID=CAMNT_0011330057 /DNA_START=90 /DNA_END=716 /DNA_ORIENTATION=+